MPFNPNGASESCLICGATANIGPDADGFLVRCSRCGDFWIDAWCSAKWQRDKDDNKIALASHLIRKMQASQSLPLLGKEFFNSLGSRSLPTPIEALDNFILYIAAAVEGRPGKSFSCSYEDSILISSIGIHSSKDVSWCAQSLSELGYVKAWFGMNECTLTLTSRGWAQYEQLITAKKSSNYAFFARQFDNPDLDRVFEECLRLVVARTGYLLRTVPQKAGSIDAIIEDDIRRCKFVIADLSDNNNGAYWEAGFAEGLGKPVIYICRAKQPGSEEEMKTHFDTNHRQTVRWDLGSLDKTARELEAVIRNTLLGDAKNPDAAID